MMLFCVRYTLDGVFKSQIFEAKTACLARVKAAEMNLPKPYTVWIPRGGAWDFVGRSP